MPKTELKREIEPVETGGCDIVQEIMVSTSVMTADSHVVPKLSIAVCPASARSMKATAPSPLFSNRLRDIRSYCGSNCFVGKGYTEDDTTGVQSICHCLCLKFSIGCKQKRRQAHLELAVISDVKLCNCYAQYMSSHAFCCHSPDFVVAFPAMLTSHEINDSIMFDDSIVPCW